MRTLMHLFDVLGAWVTRPECRWHEAQNELYMMGQAPGLQVSAMIDDDGGGGRIAFLAGCCTDALLPRTSIIIIIVVIVYKQ